MMYFCNIITSSRLYQFIALYHSIRKNNSDFYIFVLCMDDVVYRILKKASLERVSLINVSDIEGRDLKHIKKTRRIEEYCWTLKPIFIKYVLKKNKEIERLTYLDSDMFFYDDPKKILEGTKDSAVLLSEHDCSHDIKYVEDSVGRFNSGIISFKNTSEGLICLKWWKKKCMGWCFNTTATGQFGDQKYLENMYRKFHDVKIISTHGVNIAPWNDGQYKFTMKKGKLYIDEKPLILYHYSGFRICDKYTCIFMFGDRYQPLLHNIYIEAVREAIEFVDRLEEHFDGSFLEEQHKDRFKTFSMIIR